MAPGLPSGTEVPKRTPKGLEDDSDLFQAYVALLCGLLRASTVARALIATCAAFVPLTSWPMAILTFQPLYKGGRTVLFSAATLPDWPEGGQGLV